MVLCGHEKDPWRARRELSGDSETSPEFWLLLHLIPIHLKALSRHRTAWSGEGARSGPSLKGDRLDGDPATGAAIESSQGRFLDGVGRLLFRRGRLRRRGGIFWLVSFTFRAVNPEVIDDRKEDHH